MNALRRGMLYLGLMLLPMAFMPTAQAGEIIPLAVDLHKTGQTAKKNNLPVVIFFTASWCNYCHKLEQNIIQPLLINTRIEEYAVFQQVIMDKPHWMMKDFKGRSLEMEQYPEKIGVQVAPTTLVFDSNGNQIAEPILGLTLEEHYPSNLERRINQGLKALGNPKRLDIYQLIDDGLKPK